MLLCGFLGRHKLLWSGLKELKLLLALDMLALLVHWTTSVPSSGGP